MGDHRASIKIEFEMHGIKKTADMWINYSQDYHCGCHEGICEFFKNASDEAFSKYEENLYKAQKKQREAEQEQEEKKLLERLKLKYETKGQSA